MRRLHFLAFRADYSENVALYGRQAELAWSKQGVYFSSYSCVAKVSCGENLSEGVQC